MAGSKGLPSVASAEAGGYLNMANKLKDMGYLAGVNLFSIPYDWRKRPGTNDVY